MIRAAILFGLLWAACPADASSGIGLWISSVPDRANPAALGPYEVTGNAHVFLTGAAISKVDFFLDGELVQTEHNAPYDLAGTGGDGSALPFDTTQLPDGFHDLNAAVTFNNGSSRSVAARFHVRNHPGLSAGFGAETRGGLQGNYTIFKVTNLHNAGAGSLREALEASGCRLVVFEVAGTIWLDQASSIHIHNPCVTIAGETAPSPGISLANGSLAIHTQDVVVRHIRLRVGDNPDLSPADKDDRDGIKITGSRDGQTAVYRVLIDHCSVSWAIDEGISTWWPNVHDITIRDSIIGEQLSHAGHPDGEHSKALLVGDHSQRVAVIRNLLADNMERNPYIKGDASVVVVNNLIFNPGTRAAHISDAYGTQLPIRVSVVGNIMFPGLDTASARPPEPPTPLLYVYKKYQQGDYDIYLDDNAVVPPGSHAVVHLQLADGVTIPQFPLSAPPLWPQQLVAMPGVDVRHFVLANAGARPGDRDAVDERIIAGVKSGQGRIIDHQNEVGGYPCTQSVHRSLSLPADPAGDDDNDGISNIEEWLAGFSGAAFLVPPDAIYSSGFEALSCPGSTPDPSRQAPARPPREAR